MRWRRQRLHESDDERSFRIAVDERECHLAPDMGIVERYEGLGTRAARGARPNDQRAAGDAGDAAEHDAADPLGHGHAHRLSDRLRLRRGRGADELEQPARGVVRVRSVEFELDRLEVHLCVGSVRHA